MEIEVRVERDGFYHKGRQRSIDSIIIVSQELYKMFGPAGTSQLAFIRVRKDRPDKLDDKVKATPQARELANREGVQLNELRGSGADGQVLVKDVHRFLVLKTM